MSSEDFHAERPEGAPSRRRRKEPRKPRRISPQYLERAALFYLGRFSSSASNLRRVLDRKIRRSCRFHGDDPDDFAQARDALIVRFVELGHLDDRQYGEAIVRRVRRQGGSTRKVRAKLLEKGLARDLVDDLTRADPDLDPDLQAACRYTRRRRFGPYRLDSEVRGERRQRDLAALARNGFSDGTSIQVIDAESPDEIEMWIGGEFR